MSDIRPWQGIHAIIGNLVSGVDLALGLERLSLIGIYRDVTVHIFHSFLVVPYSTEIPILYFSVDIPLERLPPVTEFTDASFAVQRAVYAIPREAHLVHVDGIPPLS